MNHRSVHPTLRLPDDQASSGRAKAVAATAAGLLLGGLTVFGVAISAPGDPTLPPLVNLATEPLYMNGAKTKANLTLSLSVEFPTVGQTYRDKFDPAKQYIGYFDNKVCYTYNATGGVNGNYFDYTPKVPDASGDCKGGGFNGNFMNWATSSAIDIMRYGLTGGNRVVDEGGGNGRTIVERAFLPTDFYKNGTYFSEKKVPNAIAVKMLEQQAVIALGTKDLYIYNCRNRVYFATAQDTNGSCDKPFNVSNAKASELIGPTSQNQNDKFYEVRNLVCDPSSATNRLMTYNANTKRWRGLCMKYPNGNYKPVGQFQVNADNLRVSVFGYLIDSTVTRYGGVLRAPMKYLGPKQFDKNFNLLPTANPNAEWDKDTGVFLGNPQSGNASYGDQGYGQSGAINYINKFGTLDASNTDKGQTSIYKGFDPLSELYYESIRYLQGKQPTPQAVSGMTAKNKEKFPAYDTWVDPFAGFEDSTGDANTCLRNSILTIADTFTHRDKSVPGNTITTDGDFIRAAESSPTLDVQFWSDVVGSFESNKGLSYTDSKGRTQSASNIAGNTIYPGLANAGTLNTGSTNGSFHIAGLAYWANTQSFRTDLPKARVTTFGIDVNENNASNDPNFRRQRQIYLAAKYGGFDDKQAGYTGNPFAKGNNLLWQDIADADAKNYFLVSDAQKFLDSIADVFAKVVEETGSIAGGAVSTQRLQAGTSGGVFQARFNPVANYWSGRLLRYQLSLASDGQTVTLSDTPTWEAAEVLTNRVSTTTGLDNRNVVIGSPIGKQGVTLPSLFKWANLAQPFKDAYSDTGKVDGTGAKILDATLGQKRANYLRGDGSNEISDTNPTGLFRPRDYVLGDIVNSALVYVGKPKSLAEAGYSTFQSTNNSRPATVYVNANDGMLHAFKEADGSELFAYVPGFLGDKLAPLTDQLYTHAAFADATPAVAEAKVGADWKTVLVSGVGGGAQGVYALDVTDPTSFDKNKVLWEFTDRDSPALGNVIGAPQIVKIRDTSGASPTYKWYAVFGSGVNNYYAADGYASTTGYPSIFILDLSFVPTATSKWVEGSNFWRIELPQSSTAVAMGLVGVHAEVRPSTNALDYIYAGDLQGNVWVFNFNKDMDPSTAGVQPWSMSNMTANATTNANLVAELTDTGGKLVPLFVANGTTDGSKVLQPITTVPKVVRGLDGNLLVTVGTGKFLETQDLTVPMPTPTTASMYTLLHIVDSPKQITGLSQLQAGTLSTAGDGTTVVSIPSFVYGYPATSSSSLKMGWYFNYDATLGERQVTEIVSDGFGRLLFSSIYPTKGACGEGGGRYCELNVLTGKASCQESRVGIMAAPLVVNVGLVTSDANAQGGRWTQERYVVITQGSKGMEIATPPGGGGAVRTSPARRDGGLSWRQIHNYQELKQQNAAP